MRFLADAGLLQIALAELMKRVLATPERGVRVRLIARRANHAAVLAVLDEGPRVLDYTREPMPKPSFGTTADAASLGLALSRKIVEAHGGTLEPVPAWERGTRYEIRIPLAPHRPGLP